MTAKRRKPRPEKRIPRAAAHVVLLSNPNTGRVAYGARAGAIGHPSTILVEIDDLTMAGATEDPRELAEILIKVGTATLAQLLRYDLTTGDIRGLATRLASWAGLDLAKILVELKAGEDQAPIVEPPDGYQTGMTVPDVEAALAEGVQGISDFSPPADPGD